MGSCVCGKKRKEIKINKLVDDFAERYPITCTEIQLNEKINKYIKDTENDIQESFFKENTNDMAFELLKKEERKFLVNYLNTKKTLLTTDLNNKLNEFRQIVNNFDELTTKTINCENGEKIYKNKMKREIEKINKKLESFKIDYLSIILVGQSGVGKSTLINNFLKLKGRKVAATGTGRYVTQNISYYMSNEIPYLRLIDTRGIELNVNYGAEAVKNDTSAFIKEQLITGNINNFVSCIWYCITGVRFQQVEEDLLKALRSTYGDNSIPIIIVYTQAVDNKAMTRMDAFVKKSKIEATFIKVLAERKELPNNTFLEPFGLDYLLKETLLKCKKAIQGDMRKVMANNIALYIKDVLIKENSYIRKYINEVTVNNIINKGYTIKSHSDFENFIFNIFGNNIRYFFEKTNEIINSKNSGIFKTSEIIRNNYNVYKSFFEEKTNSIIINDINNLSIHLLDLQAKIEKTNDIHIYTKNKRLLDDFKNTSTKFFQDNFYCIAHKY
jgi:GTP-binding protein EngB required for normal cell division